MPIPYRGLPGRGGGRHKVALHLCRCHLPPRRVHAHGAEGMLTQPCFFPFPFAQRGCWLLCLQPRRGEGNAPAAAERRAPEFLLQPPLPPKISSTRAPLQFPFRA